jgi:hypothetical protein
VLISNLRASRLTLLYAQSGTGKSSVLRAGVAARLGELARRGLEQRGTAGNIPVVFSSWRDEPTDELIAEIQKSIIPFLPEASPPETTHERLEEAIDAASTAANATLLVMLDQFEEYFLYRPTEVRPGRFADELASCINRANLRANFLISIREDAFSGLGDLFQHRIDNVYGNYLHLEHLDRESARQAIEKPIACFNELYKLEPPFRIEPGLVDAVISQLSPDQLTPGQRGIGGLDSGNSAERHTDEIPAPYLQLVMLRLWDAERAMGSRQLRLQTLEELGGARTIIETYVDRTLGSLPDDDRKTAVDVFHHLVTPSGTRIALTASDLSEYTGRSVNETTALLEQLASYETRILRAIAPPPGREGGTLYEISHDLLARAILDWGRRQRAARLEFEKEAAEQQAQTAEQQAQTAGQQAQTEGKRARRFRKRAIWAAIIAVLLTILVTILALQTVGQKQAQSISVTAPASGTVGGSANLSAKATSGLPVTLSVDPASGAAVCTLSGSTVTYAAVGSCVIDATQVGDATWAAAPPAHLKIAVTRKPQTITVTGALTSAPVGVSAPLSATASSGLPVVLSIDASSGAGVCTLSGSTVTYAAAGTCVIDATQGGDATWAAAPPVTLNITVSEPYVQVSPSLPPSSPAPVG